MTLGTFALIWPIVGLGMAAAFGIWLNRHILFGPKPETPSMPEPSREGRKRAQTFLVDGPVVVVQKTARDRGPRASLSSPTRLAVKRH